MPKMFTHVHNCTPPLNTIITDCDWHFPLPEGLDTFVYDTKYDLHNPMNITQPYPKDGIHITIESPSSFVKVIYINGKISSINELPASYSYLKVLAKTSKISDVYKDYDWYKNGLRHRINNAAKISFWNEEPIGSDRYMFGKHIGYEVQKWFKESSIDINQMSDEDVEFFRLKWC